MKRTTRPPITPTQEPIHAELIGDRTASTGVFTVCADTPAFEMCRLLVSKGVNPDRIGPAATLTVITAGNGPPIFGLYRGVTGRPVRDSSPAGVSTAPAAETGALA